MTVRPTMSEEVVVQEVTEVDEDQVIQEAMERTIAEENGISLPEKEVKETPSIPDDTADSQETQEEVEPEKVDKPDKLTLLEQRLASLADENQKLRRNLDTTNGRYGNELQKLRKQIEKLSTPKASSFNPESPAFKKLVDEFPEIGTALIEGLKESEEVKEQPKEEKEEVIEEQETITHDQFSVDLAIRELRRDHPDFESVAKFNVKQIAPGMSKIEWKDPAFGEFVETLDNDDRAVIINGESPQEILRISEILSRYKQSAPI